VIEVFETDDQAYYLEQLEQQVSFLVDSCHAYDNGNFAQAKMMSAIIRTIVKDPEPNPNNKRKSNTVSLLTHLKKKENMKFYNTGFEAKKAKINLNLVGIVTVPCKLPTITKQTDNIYLPLFETSQQVDLRWLTFDDWWKSEIIVSETESFTSIFTRKRIVLTMAEQDGGNHVDAKGKVDKEYLELATAAKTYFNHVDPSGNESPIINLHFALVRQIAHELVKSLIKELKFDINYHPTNVNNLRGVPEHELKQPIMMVEGSKFESTRTKSPFKVPIGKVFKAPPSAAFVRIKF
jgi:hypothetical protein